MMKVRAGVTTTSRRPATRSRPKEEKDPLLRAGQTVGEVAQEALSRQARALAQRTGEPLVEALEAVLETPAGRQLEELRRGVHRDEETRYWQANLLFERVSEQASHPVHPA